MVRAFLESKKAIRNIEKEMVRVQDLAKEQKEFPKESKSIIEEILKEIEKIKKDFLSEMGGMEFDIVDLLGQLEASTSAPTEAQDAIIQRLAEKLNTGIKIINAILMEKIPGLQRKLNCEDFVLCISQPVNPPEPLN